MTRGLQIIIFTVFFWSLISCRNDSETLQQIDQVINLYYKDAAGKDLLNAKNPNAYNNIQFFDLNGETDQVPITSFNLKQDVDSVNFIDYASGAVRVLQDSVNPDFKTYRSDFVINLTKNDLNKTTITDQDTIKILYHWSPTLFQVSEVFYNGKLKFKKVPVSSNIITIIK